MAARIISNEGNISVDSLPEHSNSDVEGSVTSEDLFSPNENAKILNNNATIVQNEWLQLVLESPWLLSIILGALISCLLIIIGFCIIGHICRSDWPRVLLDFGFQLGNSPPPSGKFTSRKAAESLSHKLRGVENYTVTPRVSNHGWEYRNAGSKSKVATSALNMNNNDKRAINRPAPPPPFPPPPPFLSPSSEDEKSTIFANDAMEDEDNQRASKSGSIRKMHNSRPSSLAEPAYYFSNSLRRTNSSWDPTTRPRSMDIRVASKEVNIPLTTFTGTRHKMMNSCVLKAQIEEQI